MIGRLVGTLAEKSPPQLLVDANGVGYEVDVPMSTFYNLPGLGEKVTLLTHFVVREDAQTLFGFLTHAERATFRLLVKISGVGPRTALAILSGLSVDELAQAISLYVTVEPCMMCVGAMVHARIDTIVYGAVEPKAGALVSAQQAHEAPGLNHRLRIRGGVCEEECRALMQAFFKERRT